MSVIHVRTDAALKKKAQKMLKQMGLDLSSAVNLYLRQIVVTGGIPFEIRTVNGFTPAQERRMLKEAAWAKKHGKRYNSADELFQDILGKNWREENRKRVLAYKKAYG
ncbi:type II toxin-antitoxin system RelB/DinJ family antitoxin [Candidatus Peregrinibacteria bacterium]|nr:type II toxin-antitoxin system RelB/DinJ family antitoxin [Candidatus Peregrinibacteria bacterium]MBI3816364.1 type II toxin-antitoxin system RelB/DinJ family antitoxin [Candidatus Peregrinibacteria bacterium]